MDISCFLCQIIYMQQKERQSPSCDFFLTYFSAYKLSSDPFCTRTVSVICAGSQLKFILLSLYFAQMI